jgi:general stress protein 26
MTQHHSQKDVEAKLWKEIEKGRFGMLGLTGEGAGHYQPMTAFAEPDNGLIWFFTGVNTDLARKAGDGGKAMFVVQAKDQDLQACIGGTLSVDHDAARIDKYWNAMVAAWYPNGRDDPSLTLLRLDCDDAQVWLNEAGPVRFAWEIARANATGRQPDLGQQAKLNLG